MEVVEKRETKRNWEIYGLRTVDDPAIRYRINCTVCDSSLRFSISDISSEISRNVHSPSWRQTFTTYYTVDGLFRLRCPCCGNKFKIGGYTIYANSKEKQELVGDSEVLLGFLYQCATQSEEYFCSGKYPKDTPWRELTEEETKHLLKRKREYLKDEKRNQRAEKKEQKRKKKNLWADDDDYDDGYDDSSSADITIDVTFN